MKEGRRPNPSWSRRPAQVDLDVPEWIKFVTTLESLCQRHGPQKLPEDMERHDGLRPGDNNSDGGGDLSRMNNNIVSVLGRRITMYVRSKI